MDYTSYDIAKDIFLSSLDKLPSEDNEQLTLYLLDFIGKDYFAANSAYNRHTIESPKVAEYHYKLGLWVAYALTHSQFIQKLAFENKDFCPAEFLNAVSYFCYLWLGSMRKDWHKLVINELKSVSFSKMLSDGSRMVNNEVSEVEFYDCLTTCSPRTMSLFLTHVDTALGTPLRVPLIEESDCTLFLVPIATGESLAVGALYLADATGTTFDINNLYPIRSVIYSPNDDEPYRLIVSDKDGTTKTYVIDVWLFRELKQIMNNDYQWPVNCHLPFVKM